MAVTVTGPTFKQPFSYDSNGLTTSLEYNVVADSGTDTIVDVVAASGLPQPGDTHPDSTDLYCVNLEADPVQQKDNGGRHWRITANYSTVTSSVEPGASVIYPSKAATFNGTGSFEDQPTDYDKDGNAIKNFAGDPYFPPLVKKVVSKQIEIEVNLTSAPSSSLEGKVNNSTLYGGATGTVMCGPINKSGPFYERGTAYYTYRLTFLYAPETWNVRHGKVLNQGLRELRDSAVKPIQVDGVDVTEPYPLASDGTAIIDGTTTVTFSQYNLYEEVDMSSIAF